MAGYPDGNIRCPLKMDDQRGDRAFCTARPEPRISLSSWCIWAANVMMGLFKDGLSLVGNVHLLKHIGSGGQYPPECRTENNNEFNATGNRCPFSASREASARIMRRKHRGDLRIFAKDRMILVTCCFAW